MALRIPQPIRLRNAVSAAFANVPTRVAERFQRWPAVPSSVRRGLDYILLVVVLAVATGFTGYNIFGHPHYELDEGTYVGSAWTMMSKGQLFYYTYTYAHPPLGWFQIGLWSVLTGGFDRFGMSINSGRIFMLVMTVLSSLLIFSIVRYGTGRVSAGALGVIAFSASPLAVGFHRQVYLDNIGTSWLLLSVFLLQTASGRLGRITLSACAFGIAFWSKEVFIATAPGMVLTVAALSDSLQRRFAVMIWAITAGSIVSLFILLAILKDELLPSGVLWSSSKPHVSLIQTYFRQAGRDGGGLLDRHGEFWARADQWWHSDPLFGSLGVAAIGIGFFVWRWDRLAFCISVLTACFVLFLGRGGVVLYYYVIPLIALMAVAIGLVAGQAVNLIARLRPLRPAVAPLLLTGALLLGNDAFARNDSAFNANDTAAQHDAAEWIARNIPHTSLLIIDSYAWQDLRDTSMTGGASFSRANYYWPTFSDPVLKSSLLNDNWQKIDFLLVSTNTLADASRDPNLEMLQQAINRSDTIRTFKSGNWSEWIMRVRKLHQMSASEDPMLVHTWNSFVDRFIEGGRVVDPKTGLTTSEAQASAMVQALYMGDRTTFDALWEWSRTNLQVRGDGLLVSTWSKRTDGQGYVADGHSSTSGDEDTALALLFAARVWNAPSYQWEATSLLQGIWEHETVEIQSGRYVVAGSWARGDGTRGLNEPVVAPSSLAPYAYRIFAEADPSHPWTELVDSTYRILSGIRASPNLGGRAGVVPTFLRLNRSTGAPLLVGDRIANANQFSADASRILTRLTIDYLWSKDERARQAIGGLSLPRQRMRPVGEALGGLSIAYGLDGSTIDSGEAIEMYANVVPSLLITDDANLDFAHRVFAERVLRGYTEDGDGAYWGNDPDSLLAQNNAWFACALMDGSIANLWSGARTVSWNDVLEQSQ